MEEEGFALNLFSIGLGVFIGVIIVDFFKRKNAMLAEEHEHIVTSTGRKVYIAVE